MERPFAPRGPNGVKDGSFAPATSSGLARGRVSASDPAFETVDLESDGDGSHSSGSSRSSRSSIVSAGGILGGTTPRAQHD